MGRIAGLAFVVLLAALLFRPAGPAPAQDDGIPGPPDDRVAALETQVAWLAETVAGLSVDKLPGRDPEGAWIGTLYGYDHTRYEFGLVCSIAQVGYQYALRCTQVDHIQLP